MILRKKLKLRLHGKTCKDCSKVSIDGWMCCKGVPTIDDKYGGKTYPQIPNERVCEQYSESVERKGE